MGHGGCGGICKTGKLDQFFQLVVGGQRRVAQDVGYVGSAQHIQLSSHHEIVHRSLYRGHAIDKGFAVNHTAAALLGINHLDVFSLHLHVHPHVVDIGEVDVTLHRERTVVGGIHLEVFQQQMAAHNADGAFAEPEVHTILRTLQIAGVKGQLTIGIYLLQRTFHADGAIGISSQTDDAVGEETVQQS